MPGFWGNHVGIIDLKLERNGKWVVADKRSEARAVVDEEGNPLAGRDEDLFHAVESDHEATLKYIRGPVGKTKAPITSYSHRSKTILRFKLSIMLKDGTWKSTFKVQNMMESRTIGRSAFKAGTRGEVTYYTDIPSGTIAIKNVADLYLYPNTLNAVLVNGAQLKEWLEKSAGQFHQIDPSSTKEQPLVNMDYRSYNFDVIDGVEYQIDVSQPVNMTKKGKYQTIKRVVS